MGRHGAVKAWRVILLYLPHPLQLEALVPLTWAQIPVRAIALHLPGSTEISSQWLGTNGKDFLWVLRDISVSSVIPVKKRKSSPQVGLKCMT